MIELFDPSDLFHHQLEPAPLPAKASPGASVAGAAYEALLNLYPQQKAVLDAALLDFCDGAKGALGLAVLQPSLVYCAYVANAMLLQRASDPISNIVVPFGDFVAPMVPPGYSYKVNGLFFLLILPYGVLQKEFEKRKTRGCFSCLKSGFSPSTSYLV